MLCVGEHRIVYSLVVVQTSNDRHRDVFYPFEKDSASGTEEFPGGLRPTAAAAAAAADEVDSGDVALARGESIFELATM